MESDSSENAHPVQQQLQIEELREVIWRLKPKIKELFSSMFLQTRDETADLAVYEKL